MLVEFKQRFAKTTLCLLNVPPVNRCTPQSKRNIRQAQMKLKGAIIIFCQ